MSPIRTQLHQTEATLRCVREAINGHRDGLVSIPELCMTCTLAQAIAYRDSLESLAAALQDHLNEFPHFGGL